METALARAREATEGRTMTKQANNLGALTSYQRSWQSKSRNTRPENLNMLLHGACRATGGQL